MRQYKDKTIGFAHDKIENDLKFCLYYKIVNFTQVIILKCMRMTA